MAQIVKESFALILDKTERVIDHLTMLDARLSITSDQLERRLLLAARRRAIVALAVLVEDAPPENEDVRQ